MAEAKSPCTTNVNEDQNSSDSKDEARSFAAILETKEPPFIVKYDATQKLNEQLLPSSFSPDESLLVHTKQRLQRIKGRCVRFQKDPICFIDEHCDVIVPEHYQGWFAVFGDPCQQEKEPVVPHYRRVSQLAISPCMRFLVAGDRPVYALLIKKSQENIISLDPVQIQPGTQLQKGHLFTTSSWIKVKKRFRKKGKFLEANYLSVSDSQGCKFFLPCETEGLFYVLSLVEGAVQVPILKPQEILQRYSFPLVVRLVHGQLPSPPSSFNGTLLLTTSDSTPIAVATGLETSSPTCYEILQESSLPFLLQTALDDNENSVLRSKDQVDVCLQCFRFQDRNSDFGEREACSEAVNTYENVACLALPKPKGPDISAVNVEGFSLFPPSPISSLTLVDKKKSNRVLSLNLNQIKRTLTYDRPVNIKSDIIPIKTRAGSCVDSERLSSLSADATSSGSSYCSATSVPSRPESAPALLLDNAYENMQVPGHGPSYTPNDFDEYFGVWTSASARTENEFPKYSRVNCDATNRKETKLTDTSEDKPITRNSTTKPETSNEYLDESGYVMASELAFTNGRSEESKPRPASYVTMSQLDHVYDSVYVKPQYSHNTQNPQESGVNATQDGVRDLTIDSKTHEYITLEDVVDGSIDDKNVVPNSSSFPAYVNEVPMNCLSSEEQEKDQYEKIAGNWQDKADDVDKKSAYVNVKFDMPVCVDSVQEDTPAYQTIKSEHQSTYNNKNVYVNQKNGIGKGKECAESHTLNSPKTSSSPSDFGASRSVEKPRFKETNGLANSQQMTIGTVHRDELLKVLKKQGVKKDTEEAIKTLDDSHMQSIVMADDRVERLKELLPQISKLEFFKIGVCLKNL